MGQHQPATEGWVYFLQAHGLPCIKIGFSQKPEHRLADLQGASPVPLHILKRVRAPYRVEQALLALFAEYSLHHEWFRAEPPLLAFIDSLDDGQAFSLYKIFLAKGNLP